MMCKKNMIKYYKMMGFIVCVIMLAMFAGQIVTVIDLFKAKADAWPIIATFLNMLATITVGSGLANLFYGYGMGLANKN